MVVLQDELENHCRSRETCSFGTPDAVVCKAARSASAVLAAVGRSVGIGARAGAGFREGSSEVPHSTLLHGVGVSVRHVRVVK